MVALEALGAQPVAFGFVLVLTESAGFLFTLFVILETFLINDREVFLLLDAPIHRLLHAGHITLPAGRPSSKVLSVAALTLPVAVHQHGILLRHFDGLTPLRPAAVAIFSPCNFAHQIIISAVSQHLF